MISEPNNFRVLLWVGCFTSLYTTSRLDAEVPKDYSYRSVLLDQNFVLSLFVHHILLYADGILVLQCPEVPLGRVRLEFQLESLVVADLVLVCGHVHPCDVCFRCLSYHWPPMLQETNLLLLTAWKLAWGCESWSENCSDLVTVSDLGQVYLLCRSLGVNMRDDMEHTPCGQIVRPGGKIRWFCEGMRSWRSLRTFTWFWGQPENPSLGWGNDQCCPSGQCFLHEFPRQKDNPEIVQNYCFGSRKNCKTWDSSAERDPSALRYLLLLVCIAYLGFF